MHFAASSSEKGQLYFGDETQNLLSRNRVSSQTNENKREEDQFEPEVGLCILGCRKNSPTEKVSVYGYHTATLVITNRNSFRRSFEPILIQREPLYELRRSTKQRWYSIEIIILVSQFQTLPYDRFDEVMFLLFSILVRDPVKWEEASGHEEASFRSWVTHCVREERRMDWNICAVGQRRQGQNAPKDRTSSERVI